MAVQQLVPQLIIVGSGFFHYHAAYLFKIELPHSFHALFICLIELFGIKGAEIKAADFFIVGIRLWCFIYRGKVKGIILFFIFPLRLRLCAIIYIGEIKGIFLPFFLRLRLLLFWCKGKVQTLLGGVGLLRLWRVLRTCICAGRLVSVKYALELLRVFFGIVLLCKLCVSRFYGFYVLCRFNSKYIPHLYVNAFR